MSDRDFGNRPEKSGGDRDSAPRGDFAPRNPRRDNNTGRPSRDGDAGRGRVAPSERSSGSGTGRGGFDKRQSAPAGRGAKGENAENRPDWQSRVARPINYDKPKSPVIPEEITDQDLELGIRVQLKTLTPENAEKVARHLAMVGILINQDPDLAHQHALAAAERAGRIGMVREVVGVTAYTVGDYSLALRELLTYRRISGSNDQLPVMVDCERGLGRPDRALELGRSVDRSSLSAGVRVNLAIAMSGARLDREENDLALAELQIPELNPERVFNYSPSLFRAYADTLEVLGRDAEAKRWWTLGDRAEHALAGSPGPEDEVFEVLEEIEIPVMAEKKVWEPREPREASERPWRFEEDRRPPREGERKPFGDRNSSSGDRNSSSGDRNSSSGDRGSSYGDRRASSSSDRSSSGSDRRPTGDRDRRPASDNRGAASGERKTYGERAPRESFSRDRAPREGSREDGRFSGSSQAPAARAPRAGRDEERQPRTFGGERASVIEPQRVEQPVAVEPKVAIETVLAEKVEKAPKVAKVLAEKVEKAPKVVKVVAEKSPKVEKPVKVVAEKVEKAPKVVKVVAEKVEKAPKVVKVVAPKAEKPVKVAAKKKAADAGDSVDS